MSKETYVPSSKLVFIKMFSDNYGEQLLLHHKINKLNMKKSQTELNYSDNSNSNSNPNSFEQRGDFFPAEKLDDQAKESDTSNSNLQLEKHYDTCLRLADQAQEEQFGYDPDFRQVNISFLD